MRSHGTHMLPRSRPQQSFQSCKLEIRHPIVPNFQCFLPCTLPGSEGLLWFDIVIVNHTIQLRLYLWFQECWDALQAFSILRRRQNAQNSCAICLFATGSRGGSTLPAPWRLIHWLPWCWRWAELRPNESGEGPLAKYWKWRVGHKKINQKVES